MPTMNQIREAMKAKIEGVLGANNGVVHDYERFAKDQAKFRTLYLSGTRIHGYHIRRVGTREVQSAIGRYVVTHSWQMRGFMSLDDADATEKTFDTEIEAIRDAFRLDDTLGGLVASLIDDEQAGIQVLESGPVMLSDVLCHGAKLAAVTIHFQS